MSSMRRLFISVIFLFISSIAYTAELEVYIRHCNNGEKDACYRLGKYYESIEEYLDAIKYYNTACSNGSPNSCFNLGSIYGSGKGVKVDKEKSVKYFDSACKLNLKKACDLLK